jgi:hypothetical protein
MKIWKFRFSLKKKVITRIADEKEVPYIWRWNLISTPWFGIKIHKILISDDACLHCHPWSFITFIFKGGYYETTNKQYRKSEYRFGGWDLPQERRTQWTTWRGPGSILYRPAAMPHRLDLPIDVIDLSTQQRTYKHAYTLVLNFKRTREWGFWTPLGWLQWEKYSSVNSCE